MDICRLYCCRWYVVSSLEFTTEERFNNLWVYDQQYFTWMSGNQNTGNYADVYGTSPGILDSSNIPGSTTYAISFLDKQGLMNVFGGFGFIGGSSQQTFKRELHKLKLGWARMPISKM
jgi:hypothetical protein